MPIFKFQRKERNEETPTFFLKRCHRNIPEKFEKNKVDDSGMFYHNGNKP